MTPLCWLRMPECWTSWTDVWGGRSLHDFAHITPGHHTWHFRRADLVTTHRCYEEQYRCFQRPSGGKDGKRTLKDKTYLIFKLPPMTAEPGKRTYTCVHTHTFKYTKTLPP